MVHRNGNRIVYAPPEMRVYVLPSQESLDQAHMTALTIRAEAEDVRTKAVGLDEEAHLAELERAAFHDRFAGKILGLVHAPEAFRL